MYIYNFIRICPDNITGNLQQESRQDNKIHLIFSQLTQNGGTFPKFRTGESKRRNTEPFRPQMNAGVRPVRQNNSHFDIRAIIQTVAYIPGVCA
jgi:hypothetical protein